MPDEVLQQTGDQQQHEHSVNRFAESRSFFAIFFRSQSDMIEQSRTDIYHM